jgi:hypothetical protein
MSRTMGSCTDWQYQSIQQPLLIGVPVHDKMRLFDKSRQWIRHLYGVTCFIADTVQLCCFYTKVSCKTERRVGSLSYRCTPQHADTRVRQVVLSTPMNGQKFASLNRAENGETIAILLIASSTHPGQPHRTLRLANQKGDISR